MPDDKAHKPSRFHHALSGFFHSRSRSVSPKPQEPRHGDVRATQRVEQAALQQKKYLLPPTTSTEQVASSQASNPLPVEDHERVESNCPETQEALAVPDIGNFPDKFSGNAYDDAWSQLSEDAKMNLSKETSIKTLFEKLEETDQQDQSSSWLKRGKMATGLRYVSQICSYVNLVTTWIPVPSLDAAVNLFKGIIAIAVGIFGAYDGLTSHIRELLDHIPIIERCNSVTWSNINPEIHKTLVTCYIILLSFYSNVMAFLQISRSLERIQEIFHSQIPGIVGDFNDHADKLSKLMVVEGHVTVSKIWNMQVNQFVEDRLYQFSSDRIDRRDAEERNRSDEACRWITSEETFTDWEYGAHGVLTMYGVVGCGKTATASYVAKYLREKCTKEGDIAPVLVYHCMQQEEDKLRLIYCSLTYQLLQKKAELKDKFQRWFEDRQATSEDKPSNEPRFLAKFLWDALLEFSREHVFIILDGLDECEQDVRNEVLALFRDLIGNKAMVKVFVSSQQRDDILQTLNGPRTIEKEPVPGQISQIPLFHIDMDPSEERDRTLATHLATRYLDRLNSKVRKKAIDLLAKRAKGSAIWLKMAMESLALATNELGIKECLEFLETSPGLIHFYQRLFKSADKSPYIDVLERALETLAVARRPLSIDELSRAAFIDRDDVNNTKRLDDLAGSVDFLSLIRPFVAILGRSEDGKALMVRLVHESLRDLLLQGRPSEWSKMAARTSPRRLTKEQRSRELNEQLMGRCVKYLLLENAEDESLDEDADSVPDTDVEDSQEDDNPALNLDTNDTQEDDDSVIGFGHTFEALELQDRADQAVISNLHFYDYAARHWTSHFAACEKDVPEKLKESAKTLLDVNASECINWVSFIRAKRWAAREVFPGSFEPVTLTAYFGLTETLADMLADSNLVPQPAKQQALLYACQRGHDRIVKLLLQNGVDVNHQDRTGRTPLSCSAEFGTITCLKHLLKMEGVDVNHQDQAGRTPLFCSAEFGTITCLKQLLDTEGVDVNLPDNKGRSPLIWAAFTNQAECVDVLMQHPNIDKTAVDSEHRKNAIHWACTSWGPTQGRHEALRCLLKHHCPGINEPDITGWTPLMWAIDRGPQCVESLLETGRVEVDRRDISGKTALSLAVQWNSSPAVVKVLLDHGADPETTDHDGQTLLDLMTKGGRPEDFMVVQEIKSRINKKRSAQSTYHAAGVSVGI